MSTVTTPQRAASTPGTPTPSPSLSAGASSVATEGPSPAPRLRALDGLRLLAALSVAAYHYGGRDGEISQAWGSSPSGQFPTLAPLFAYGCLGVQLFFVISGFVICMSGWGRTLRAFAASRVSRLMPAYWAAVVLVSAVFALPWVAYEAVSPSDALVNLTMLQEPMGVDRVLGVCWTLWAELRFYLLFALFVVLPGARGRGETDACIRRRALRFCAAWTLAAVLAQGSDWGPLNALLMPQYAPFFIGGVGLYLLHRFGHDAAAWALVALSWLLGQHYAVADLWHGGPGPGGGPYFSYRSSLAIIAFVTLAFAAVAAVALGPSRLAGGARWRWLTTAGALTYPFYLVHEHLGWVAVRALHQWLGLPSWAVLPLTVLAMLALAWMLHRAVERPLGRRLKRSLS
jgi:peptidoglycan/LPS O-acetylase OafA/YrhL